MIVGFERFLAYRCPACGRMNIKELNVFDFAGKFQYTGTCECGEKCFTITPRRDKYYISFSKCPNCLDAHSYTLSRKYFWSKKCITLFCSTLGIGTISIGGYDDVEEEANFADKQLNELMDELDFSNDEEILSLTEGALMLQALDIIQDMAGDGKLFCTCGCNEIGFGIEGSSISLTCSECCGEEIIPMECQEDLDRLASRDYIIIKKGI